MKSEMSYKCKAKNGPMHMLRYFTIMHLMYENYPANYENFAGDISNCRRF